MCILLIYFSWHKSTLSQNTQKGFRGDPYSLLANRSCFLWNSGFLYSIIEKLILINFRTFRTLISISVLNVRKFIQKRKKSPLIVFTTQEDFWSFPGWLIFIMDHELLVFVSFRTIHIYSILYLKKKVCLSFWSAMLGNHHDSGMHCYVARLCQLFFILFKTCIKNNYFYCLNGKVALKFLPKKFIIL